MSTNSLYPGTTNGVCVTSIIKDKIREYMMGDSPQQIIKSPVEISMCEMEKNKIDSVIHENKSVNKQDPVSTTDLVLPSSLNVSIHNSTEPCPHKQDLVTSVRRIGNSLDALLQESKKASRTKPVKKSSLTNQNSDRLFISSDQLRSRKSVSLHDICEEYIQFITVNSSISADEEAISTTSGNETEIDVKNEEIELEIIPVGAASIRNSQISVITINENLPRKLANSVIKQSVEEMHVAVENECEKSNGESENNAEKLSVSEVVEKDSHDEIFTNVNGIKSASEKPVSPVAEQTEINVDEKKEEEKDENPTLNGITDASDDIEEDADEDDVKESPQIQEPESSEHEKQAEQHEPEPKPIEQEQTEDEPEQSKDESEVEPAITQQEPVDDVKLQQHVEKVETETEQIAVKESSDENDQKMETEEEKSPSLGSPLIEESTVEKIQEPVVRNEIEENIVENEPPAEVVANDNENVDEKMDTSEVDTVIKTDESIKPEETKSEPVPSTEPKLLENIEKEKEIEIKKKPAEDVVPEAKIEKKSPEPEKEPSPKDAANTTGVKRKADSGEEIEQDRDGGISSSSSSSCSEVDNTQDCKRIRFDESIFEEDERERLIREFVERSTESSEEIGKNCDKLQHEIAALSDLARAKELEWNSIMRLLKLKEEMLERILFKKRHFDCQNKPELDANLNKMFKNFVTSSTPSIDQNKPNRSETCTPTSVNNHVTVVPIGSSTTATSNGATTSNTSQDLFGTKSAMNSILSAEAIGKLRPPHRPILPKPPVTSAQNIQPAALNMSHAPLAQQTVQQQTLQPHSSQASMMQPTSLLVDQNSIIGEGRQGPILDVKSIIADFRSKNPDSLPRRGRRNLPFGSRIPDGGAPRFLANTSLLSMANMALGSGSHVRTSVTSTTHNDHRPSSFIIGQDNSVPTSLSRSEMQMRHPNIDSLMLSVNQAAAAAASGNSSQPNSSTNSNSNNSSFQEALVKFAKMNEKRDISSNAALHLGNTKGGSHLPPPPPYPEVTLHPVLVPPSSGSPPVQNSLLHGILTKSNAAAAAASQHHPSSTVGNVAAMSATSVGNIQHRPTTFSPTLARLLTAPERNRAHRAAVGSSGRNTKSTLNEILNNKKTRTEVTITPVTTSTACATKNGSDVVLDDDDESEATDRLVIDEGREVVAESASNVIPADQVPECQGCHKKAAQFVCAGCGNQWYCSRDCQVQAWEEHSEMCSG